MTEMLSLLRVKTTPLAATALLVSLAACSSIGRDHSPGPQGVRNCTAGLRLEVGQSCGLLVEAARKEVPLPIKLDIGDKYVVQVLGGHVWSDWGRDAVNPLVGDQGNWLMRLFSQLKRMPAEPYMVIGLAVSGCNPDDASDCRRQRFEGRLGSAGYELAVPEPLSVRFFANDVPWLNGNNSGAVWVLVQRY